MYLCQYSGNKYTYAVLLASNSDPLRVMQLLVECSFFLFHPVMISRGGYVLAVNSKALELANFTKDKPNLNNGVIIKNPETNEPTGILMKNAATIVKGLVAQPLFYE